MKKKYSKELYLNCKSIN